MTRIEDLSSGAVVVHFDDEDVTQAPEHARAALEAALEAMHKGMMQKYRNDKGGHLVGKLGEYAVEAWFQSRGVLEASPFRDSPLNNAPDLVAGGQGIEVKTRKLNGWVNWGRCVTPLQLPLIAKRSAYIVWAVLGEAEKATVTIHGWSTPAEVRTYPPRCTGPAYRLVLNHRVPLDQIHPASTLALG